MTRMIPETIHSSVQSTAEKRIFEVIRDAPNTDNWVCLHSLGLAHHETKRRAEIDFALITHHGIFILEVKGGRLKRRAGTWYSVNKRDELHKLNESPFDQASSAMFALQKRIRAHFKKNTPQADALFGYGVLTPDITFDLDSPESSRELVYDRRDTEKPFTTYINRLAEFARTAESRDKRPALKPDAIEAIADFLRGDFDFIPSPELVIDDVRKQLNDLTKEQRIVLDVLQDSERVLV
ncbi:MAG: NERD domain-containing protein, partial [Deltaproteobacteria bacterium]|nr:NERD domain-containing protein [Deltaproteobacteria bacterium]